MFILRTRTTTRPAERAILVVKRRKSVALPYTDLSITLFSRSKPHRKFPRLNNLDYTNVRVH